MLSTITVTSLEDNMDVDGEVTLREAIEAANTDRSVDGSVAGDGADRIRFANGIEGTIELTAALDVLESVEVIGHGSEQTRIAGTDQIEAFVVPEDTETVELTLRALRIRTAEVAVRHDGESGVLRIVDSRLRKNGSAVRIQDSDLHIEGSEIFGSNGDTPSDRSIAFGRMGGASSSRRIATIADTRITGNSLATEIRDAQLAVRNVLYTGNHGAFSIYNSDGDIDNSSFVSNSSDAIYVFSSNFNSEDEIFVNHGTIVGNTGVGISSFARHFKTNVYLTNSVLGSNVLENGASQDIHADGGSATSSGYGSVVVNYSFLGGTDHGTVNGEGNILGSSENPLDPMLGPLQHNGGPVRSMVPESDSPIIDAGAIDEKSFFWSETADVSSDTTGLRRPVGGAPDLGAVEATDVRLVVTPTAGHVQEGDSVTFNITLETQLQGPLRVSVNVSEDSSAHVGRDYIAIADTLDFDGTRGSTVELTLETLDDEEFEFDETLKLEFASETQSELGYSETAITIVSDETSGLGLSGDKLAVRGTNGRDNASITRDGDQIVGQLNEQSFSVDASLVEMLDIDLLNGSDSLMVSNEVNHPVFVSGGLGADSIFTGSGHDTVFGGIGNDLIETGAGRDSVDGGDGHDTIHGQAGGDRLQGNSGDDSITGQGGFDVIDGGEGNDTLSGGDLNDTLHGGAGADLMMGGPDRDDMTGGFGSNTLMGGDGNDYIIAGGSESYADGGGGDDFLIGFGTLLGNRGNDRILVSSAAPTAQAATLARGGLGNDDIKGGRGDDTLHGGSGNDWITIAFSGGGRNILIGSSGNDTILGGDGADLLVGNDGRDVLIGREGDDTLEGNSGADFLRGSEGDDRLIGGPARDILIGGTDADVLFGNDGQDLLISGWIDELSGSRMTGVRNEWFSDRNFAIRKANLTDGSGSTDRVNEDKFLIDTGVTPTVFDDNAPDTVNGGSGIDWFFYNETHDDFSDL